MPRPPPHPEESLDDYLRRMNVPLPQPSAAVLWDSEPMLLSFAEYWLRNPALPVATAERRYHAKRKQQEKTYLAWLPKETERRRERCRRALNDDARFALVAAAVRKVEAQWRRKGVDPLECMRRLNQAWLALRVTVENSRRKADDRALEWAGDRKKAVAAVGEAIDELRAVLARHPWIKGLEHVHVVEDLVRAYQRLATDFPSARRGRPRARGRDWVIWCLNPKDTSDYAIERVLRAAGLIEKTPEKSSRK